MQVRVFLGCAAGTMMALSSTANTTTAPSSTATVHGVISSQ
jgi:hypothetical protein